MLDSTIYFKEKTVSNISKLIRFDPSPNNKRFVPELKLNADCLGIF